MFDIGSVVAHIKADITNFKKGLEDAQGLTGSLKSGISKLGDGFDELRKQSTVLAAAGFGALIVGAKLSVDAYKEAEAAQKMLEHAVINVSKAKQKDLQATMDLADALERKGVLDGDNIKVGLAQLSTFGLSNKAVQGLGASLADLAVNQFGVSATGDQLSQSANMMAKALRGQFGVLEKSGIRFTDAQKAIIATGTEMEKVKAINEGFQQNLKYTNDVALTTFEGKMAKVKVGVENVQEVFGKLIVGGLLPLISGLQGALPALENFANQVTTVFTLISEAFNKDFDIGAWLSPEDYKKFEGFIEILRQFQAAFAAFASWVSDNQELVMTFLTGLGVALGTLLILGTVNALIMAMLNPISIVMFAIAAFYTAFQTNFLGVRDIVMFVVNAIVGFFNEILLPFITFVVEFFRANWNDIVMIIDAAWTIIKALIEIALAVIMAIVIGFITIFKAFWKEYGEYIVTGTKGAWEIIKGVFQVTLGIIAGLLSFFLNAAKGDWSAAWNAISNMTDTIWAGLKNILNGGLGFIRGWGGAVVDALTKPFRDAWNQIQDLVNKIKNAMDFTKRHSPSVLDIVQSGVAKVNKALSGLEFDMGMSAQMAGASIMNQGPSNTITSITVDMNGAFISDEYGAERMGEKVGDAIIKKLQKNVRF